MKNLKRKVQLPVTILVADREYVLCPMVEGRDVELFGTTRIIRVMCDDADAGEEYGRHFAMHWAEIPRRLRGKNEYGFVFAGWRHDDGSYVCLTHLGEEFAWVYIRITDNGDFRGWGLCCACQ